MQNNNSIIKKLKSPISITLILLCFTLLISDYNFRWKNEKWKYTIYSDASFYYHYLPMVFVDHHFDSTVDNPKVIKYYVGTAIFNLPFFTMAYFFSYLFNLPLDGNSMLFPIFISLGTLFYLLWGLYYLSKFLRYYALPDWVIALVLVALSSGTLAYYTVMSPGWSHLIAFSITCFLLYHLKKIYTNFNKLSLFVILTSFACLFFIRPTDVVIFVFAPFLANDWKSFVEIFKKAFREKEIIFISALVSFIPLMCQLTIYKVCTGHFIIWSYSKEGFDFLHPEIMSVLFGFEKGLFVYTPICLLALFGLLALYKKSSYQFLGILIYLALNIYIISAWWCWNYGWTFGTRAFIESYPIFFLLLALLLNNKSTLVKVGTIGCILFFSAINILQIYQAEHGILDVDFRTTAKGYRSIFLKTSGYSGKYYRFPVDESEQNVSSRVSFFNDMEKIDTTWINPYTQNSEKAHSGKFSSKVNNKAFYSTGKYVKWGQFPYKRNVLIRVSGWFYVSAKGSNSYFTICFSNKGKSLNFNPFALDGYTDNYGTWEYHTFEMYMPKVRERPEQNEKDHQLEFYLYNDSDIDCYVDDLKIEFIEFKKLDRVLDRFWD